MAVVGVASFAPVCGEEEGEPPTLLGTLLVDLLAMSLSQLSGSAHLSYSHNVLQAVARVGPRQLKEAVVVSLPSLLSAVTGYWGMALPEAILEKVVAVVSTLFNQFNG